MGSNGGCSSFHCPKNEEGEASSSTKRERTSNSRHTPQQLHRLQEYYEECRFPNRIQKEELSDELGLTPSQILFWFQNRRNQTKVKKETSENAVIRENNEKLIYENSVLKEALGAAKCSSCGDSDSSQLVQENAKLQLEYSVVTSQFVLDIAKQFAQPLLDLVGAPCPLSSTQNPGSEDLHIYEAAKKATDELIKLLVMDDVFWVKSETEGQSVLNLENYQRIISPRNYFIRNGMLKESSKASGLVHLNGKTLVDLLLDSRQRMNLLTGIISESRTIRVHAFGDLRSRSGTLLLVQERVHAISPVIKPRELYVLRHCQQIGIGKWVIADVSYEYDRNRPLVCQYSHVRLPSGCLIQDLANGYSEVTLVEHVLVDPNTQVSQLYRDVIQSGLAFGAKNWICTLQTKTERNSKMSALYLDPAFELEFDTQRLQCTNERRKILGRSYAMVRSFYSLLGMSGTIKDVPQNNVVGYEESRVVIGKNPAVDEPAGLVVSASTSLLLPISTNALFDLLCDPGKRSKWDSLTHDGVRVVANIPTRTHQGNNISVIMPLPETNNGIIQESSTNATGAQIVYVPYTAGLGTESKSSTRCKVSGFVWLPSGFTISSEGRPNRFRPSTSSGGGGLWPDGCILTAVFNFRVADGTLLVDPRRICSDHVGPLSAILTETVKKIKLELYLQYGARQNN